MSSPVFFIKKKDGSLQLVQDYQALNVITIKNKYLLPLISELINKLQGARYFTKLNVRWGFNNIQMKDGDEWKAAFRTNRGLYELLVMFFGLTNSPAVRGCSTSSLRGTVLRSPYLDLILSHSPISLPMPTYLHFILIYVP